MEDNKGTIKIIISMKSRHAHGQTTNLKKDEKLRQTDNRSPSSTNSIKTELGVNWE